MHSMSDQSTPEGILHALPLSPRKAVNARLVGYWVCTALIALSFLSGGAADLMRSPQVVQGMTNLGYPAHFATILGFWKVLGGAAILAPGLPRLKEWAYAGMIFDLTGAAMAHAAAGDSDAWMGNVGHIITPLVLAALVVGSWALRPESRKMKQA
jgi:uncharacterized membrane protein YphA (DoxX/SURF4 family)